VPEAVRPLLSNWASANFMMGTRALALRALRQNIFLLCSDVEPAAGPSGPELAARPAEKRLATWMGVGAPCNPLPYRTFPFAEVSRRFPPDAGRRAHLGKIVLVTRSQPDAPAAAPVEFVGAEGVYLIHRRAFGLRARDGTMAGIQGRVPNWRWSAAARAGDAPEVGRRV